jgi:hypothetical protein
MALESELQRKTADVAALERQVESLSRKLAAAQRRLDADDDEMRRLASESHSTPRSPLSKHHFLVLWTPLTWLTCWDTDELQSQRSAIGSNVSAVKSLEARAASSSEEGAMLRARLNDMTRERVRLSKTSTTLAIFDPQTLMPPSPPWLGDLTPVRPLVMCAPLC